MSGETIFSTTGNPIDVASFAASAADEATPSFGTGMAYASHTSLPSGAVSDVRPSLFTLSRIFFTADLSCATFFVLEYSRSRLRHATSQPDPSCSRAPREFLRCAHRAAA